MKENVESQSKKKNVQCEEMKNKIKNIIFIIIDRHDFTSKLDKNECQQHAFYICKR